MQKYTLSKSTFIRGLQCEKSLYLYKHNYNLKDEISPQLQAIFDQGTNVGILAQDLFPGGVDASPSSHFKMQESVFKTKEFIDVRKQIIYEATFQFNGVLAALDILVKDDEGWKAYEVKSSTKVSETYINDAAIQYYILTNAGIDLKDISIVYINNQYVKNGEIEVDELFNIESVLEEIKPLLPEIPDHINAFKKILHLDTAPTIDIGPHCNEPYSCDFMGHCWKHIPDYSVFDIANLYMSKKFELYENGILEFDQIDLENNSFNTNQMLQITSELSRETYIDHKKIDHFLKELTYPLYFLDFETMSPAVPVYDHSRPYQQLVFQYSLHVQDSMGAKPLHFEYLAEANPAIDPRIDFVEQLIKECDSTGDILIYNISFEKGKLNDLLAQFPQYSKELTGIVNRLKDLMIPFQNRWYYTPEMRGKYSIKNVLPALVPELSYNDLEIKEGGTASSTFHQMIIGAFEGDREKTRKDLLEYCKLDTYAMVKVLEKLYLV